MEVCFLGFGIYTHPIPLITHHTYGSRSVADASTDKNLCKRAVALPTPDNMHFYWKHLLSNLFLCGMSKADFSIFIVVFRYVVNTCDLLHYTWISPMNVLYVFGYRSAMIFVLKQMRIHTLISNTNFSTGWGRTFYCGNKIQENHLGRSHSVATHHLDPWRSVLRALKQVIMALDVQKLWIARCGMEGSQDN